MISDIEQQAATLTVNGRTDRLTLGQLNRQPVQEIGITRDQWTALVSDGKNVFKGVAKSPVGAVEMALAYETLFRQGWG